MQFYFTVYNSSSFLQNLTNYTDLRNEFNFNSNDFLNKDLIVKRSLNQISEITSFSVTPFNKIATFNNGFINDYKSDYSYLLFFPEYSYHNSNENEFKVLLNYGNYKKFKDWQVVKKPSSEIEKVTYTNDGFIEDGYYGRKNPYYLFFHSNSLAAINDKINEEKKTVTIFAVFHTSRTPEIWSRNTK